MVKVFEVIPLVVDERCPRDVVVLLSPEAAAEYRQNQDTFDWVRALRDLTLPRPARILRV